MSDKNLAKRVATRFCASLVNKTALLQPYRQPMDWKGKPFDAEKEIDKGKEMLKAGLPLAKQAVAWAKKKETEAKSLQKEAIKFVEDCIEALDGLGTKTAAPFSAECHLLLAKVKNEPWTAYLGYQSALDSFIKLAGLITKKLRPFLVKNEGKEPVKKFITLWGKPLKDLYEGLRKMQEQKEADSLGYDLWQEVRWAEILVPSQFGGRETVSDQDKMVAYNDLLEEVKGVSNYMTIYEDQIETRYGSLVSNLEEMLSILDKLEHNYVHRTYADPDSVMKDKK